MPLYLEYLQGQMNFWSEHKGLHSQAIGTENLINVSNGHFLWDIKPSLPAKNKSSYLVLGAHQTSQTRQAKY